jgi:DNA-binding NarL/FixJ family response regulator
MEMGSRIHLLIVDDHATVREGYGAVFGRQDDIEIVGEAANGEEAVALFRLHRPDVTLMDVRMPVMNGIEATEAICRAFPTARILVLTAMPDEGQEGLARHAGASRFLLKDVPSQELLAAIRSLAQTEEQLFLTSAD